jgi:predicted  nucleic acid-binding Zn-ribbon protein
VAVMARETWTDERLDDLATGIDRRFDQVDKRFDQVDQRFDRVEDDIRELRSDMKKGFEAVDKKFDAKFDSLQRNMTTWFIAMFSATITLAAAVIAAAALG